MSSASNNKGKSKATKPKDDDIQFPVERMLRDGHYGDRLAATTSVYLSAVLEYMTAEVLQLAGQAAKDSNKGQITPRHIHKAISNDEDLSKLCNGVVISGANVTPQVNERVVPKKDGKRAKGVGGGSGSKGL